jgi:hypothetical protein
VIGALVGGRCGVRAWGAGQAADPSVEIQQQYERVLQTLRRPAITGVLITEILPDSAAGAAGLRGGDIITQFDGEPVDGLAVLRERLAAAMAERIEEGTTTPLVVRARRTHAEGKSQEISAFVRREPLGIRAVEVQAGAEGPRNPPPSLRGKIKLNWEGVLDTLRADNGVFALRTQERSAGLDANPSNAASRPAEESAGAWLGWQRYRITSDAPDRLSASIELARIDPAVADVQLLEQATFTFRLRLGDYYTAPAFLLESAASTYTGPDGATVHAEASRLGETLRAQTEQRAAGATAQLPPSAPVRITPPPLAPLTALVQPAAPLVAAAMPHEAGAVLAVHLVSVRDFLARPGYVLATRGREPLPFATEGTAAERETGSGWRVDLLHFGVAVESYWFSDSCRLLCVQSGLGTPVVSRRVLNPADVDRPAERRRPRTSPSPLPMPPATRPAPGLPF